jgi:hypothetical protein
MDQKLKTRAEVTKEETTTRPNGHGTRQTSDMTDKRPIKGRFEDKQKQTLDKTVSNKHRLTTKYRDGSPNSIGQVLAERKTN